MNNSDINTFVNRLLEITDTTGIKPVRNPAIKYVKVAGDRAMTVPDRTKEAKRQEKMSPAPVPEAQTPGRGRIDKQPVEEDAFRFDLTDRGLLNSFIMSEVIGRPKCLRPGRRPYGR